MATKTGYDLIVWLVRWTKVDLGVALTKKGAWLPVSRLNKSGLIRPIHANAPGLRSLLLRLGGREYSGPDAEVRLRHGAGAFDELASEVDEFSPALDEKHRQLLELVAEELRSLVKLLIWK